MTNDTAPIPNPPAERSALAAYFFSRGWTTRLAVMRIICVGLALLYFRFPMWEHLNLLANPGFEKPQWLISAIAGVVGEDHFRQAGTLWTLHVVTSVAGTAAVLGVFSRTSVGVFAVGMTIEAAHVYSYHELHHVETTFVMFLMMLACSPCGDCLSFDAWWQRRKRGRPWWAGSQSRLAMWPIVAVHVLLALVYADAAWSKLLVGGPHWFNGYTMQQHLLFDGVRKDIPLGLWAAQFRELGVAMAVGAVVFEGLFFLVLIPRLRRWVPLILLMGVTMHLGIHFLHRASFFTWLVLYLTWVPWERFVGRPGASSAVATKSAQYVGG